MKTIRVTEEERIEEIEDCLGHALLNIDEMRLDKDKQILVIPLSVVLYDKEIRYDVKSFMGIFMVKEKWHPVAEAELIFRGVVDFDIRWYRQKSCISSGSCCIIWEDDQLTIQCMYDAEITLDVTSHDIECVISDMIVAEIKMSEIGLAWLSARS